MSGASRVVGAVLLVAALASWASALEIQVAPQMLVLSSAGGKLTVHTDVPFSPDADVGLWVNKKAVDKFRIYPDTQGNLVAQCTKETVETLLEDLDWDEKFEEVPVTLEVNGESATEPITVKQ